ncbi:hypothetical protein AB0F52_34295 [Amycolatopsis sp. NPDC024027]|uniref:hypothetical protein n=1 Tax=Amycolatopsis sp. NPDC024027 TaxID=3154327 RepID=UPI0033C828F5
MTPSAQRTGSARSPSSSAHAIPVPGDHDFPVARPAAFGKAMLRAVAEPQA